MKGVRICASGKAIELDVLDCEGDEMTLLIELSRDGKGILITPEDGEFRCYVRVKRLYHLLQLVAILKVLRTRPDMILQLHKDRVL